MHGLTYGVIRVDSEEKLSVLTVQDVGLVMPGGERGGPGPQTLWESRPDPSRGRRRDQWASPAPLAGVLGTMLSSSLLTCLLSFMVSGKAAPPGNPECSRS